MSTIATRAPSRVLVLLTVIVAGFLLLLASAVQASGPAPASVEYEVSVGDSLWEVAAAHAEPGEDLRAIVFEIKQLNDLPDSVIHPGQRLLVPAG